MATTHRSDLIEELEKALNDEVYDGGMGALSPDELTRLVRKLAMTAVSVIVEARTTIAELDARQAAMQHDRVDWFPDYEIEPKIAHESFVRGWDAAASWHHVPRSEPQGEPTDAGVGWFEWFKMPENTTEIAYVHESGEVFDPVRGWNPVEFTIASAEGRVFRLVRAGGAR